MEMKNVFGKEITVIDYFIGKSGFADCKSGKFLKLKFIYEGKEYISFTGSSVLIRQIEQYKDNIPFITTIKNNKAKMKEYFIFT
jgi:hypothetical protein